MGNKPRPAVTPDYFGLLLVEHARCETPGHNRSGRGSVGSSCTSSDSLVATMETASMVTTILLHVVSGSRGCSRRPVLGPGSPAAVAAQGAARGILGDYQGESAGVLRICAR